MGCGNKVVGGYYFPGLSSSLLALEAVVPTSHQSMTCCVIDLHVFVRQSEIIADSVRSFLRQAACNLDKSQGGYKGLSTPNEKRQFELLHFNGIAKSITNGGDAKAGTSGGVGQRPRLTRLKVTVPPKWTPDEMLVADSLQALKEEEAMHAPLVDCIRSRWQRATCNWLGQEPPSIV